MRHRSASRCFVPVLVILGMLQLAACSSGSGGGAASGFQLTRISFLDGQILKVNQEMVFTFNADVDFSSVSSNTISIQTTSGTPATGTYFLRATNQVVFQPACPTLSDRSDTGLTAGAVPYVVRVLGRSSGAANTVRSTGGARLEVTQIRNFTTDNFGQEFLDTQPGPPAPVRIDVADCAAGVKPAGTFVELGDAGNRVDFLLDDAIPPVPGADQDGDGAIDDADGDGFDDDAEPELCDQGLRLPLNFYSSSESRIAVVIEFNQPLHPAETNISENRMRLEFFELGLWKPLETLVTLEANCTLSGGARVRLEPIGLLPRNAKVRAVVLVGLQDLVFDATSAVEESFAVVPSSDVEFQSLVPADSGSDEFLESFDFGGTSTLSFQDTDVFSELPSATWENGRLTAAFVFEGGGGPGGDFDWLVQDGDSIPVDTDGGTIQSDDGTVQHIAEGVVHVRNLTIEDGGEVRVQGSRPLRIHATGTVIIRGLLDLSGFDAGNVSQVNTGDRVETGASGGPGGGRGGHANEIVTNSTSRGGTGQGPLLSTGLGGLGGETGFAPASMGKDARRPGGGGGGRFAHDQGVGLRAEEGRPGSDEASGALPPNDKPPSGGGVSSGPFVDGPTNTGNDFFGTRAIGVPGNVTDLIRGELPDLWGGYGGGGGGNANPAGVFPTPNWTKASDEKGAAGGGGGGGLLIRALGPIQFGVNGLIRCDGGSGGIGENVLAQDHVGGNGGSGSGGHVVLETAAFIDFTDGGANPTLRDHITAFGGPAVQGAATSAGDVSFGGAGGPGVIQLHVPANLTPPASTPGASDLVVPGGNSIDTVTSPAAKVLIPAFSSSSQARSDWISIGKADTRPGGPFSLLQFLFEGTDTTLGANEGKILVSDVDLDGEVDDVTPLAPLVEEDLEGNPDVVVLADRVSLRISAANGRFTGFNDLYLRNPALLESFVLRLSVAAESQDFVISSAAYDDAGARLSLTVAEVDGDLQDFVDANAALGTIRFELIPRFFRVVTAGVQDSLPSPAFVRIRFQGAADDGSGAPDETNLLVNWTGDIGQFNNLVPGDLQFFRFEVQFDLGAQVTGDTQAVSLDFLRIPFVF